MISAVINTTLTKNFRTVAVKEAALTPKRVSLAIKTYNISTAAAETYASEMLANLEDDTVSGPAFFDVAETFARQTIRHAPMRSRIVPPIMSRIFESALNNAAVTFSSLANLSAPINHAADLIGATLTSGSQLLACGNGGSAADAADFTTEFACRFVHDRKPYPALNLSAGGSLVTATANDYSFDEVFARQVRAFGRSGDALVAISTSGKSRNIRRALEEARCRGLRSIALLGRDGGDCTGIADVELIVPGDSTARIQEAHKFLLHVLCEMVEPRLAPE